jgi:hypothetical protein
MICDVKPAVLAAVLALTGVAATTDRAEAQVYYPYYPTTGYYYNAAPLPTYATPFAPQASYSYYTPAIGTSTAPAYTPVRAWDGGWTVSGYTSPAVQYYNSYRATTPGFRR